jgi:hypothetical protein
MGQRPVPTTSSKLDGRVARHQTGARTGVSAPRTLGLFQIGNAGMVSRVAFWAFLRFGKSWEGKRIWVGGVALQSILGDPSVLQLERDQLIVRR